jgi:hypothetical protein
VLYTICLTQGSRNAFRPLKKPKLTETCVKYKNFFARQFISKWLVDLLFMSELVYNA